MPLGLLIRSATRSLTSREPRLIVVYLVIWVALVWASLWITDETLLSQVKEVINVLQPTADQMLQPILGGLSLP